MRRKIWAVRFLPLLVLSGCTTALIHERLQPGAQPQQPGFSYYLPRQQFIVTATFELKSCPDSSSADPVAVSRPLTISQTAAIVESSVADTDELYSIPIETMTSGWKTTTFTATVYENQTLHTVGMTVDDRSGAITKGVLGTALSIARVGIGAISPAAATGQTPRPPALCHPNVYKALDVVRNGNEKLVDPSLDEKARASLAAAITSARALLQITQVYIFNPAPQSLEASAMLGPKLAQWFSNPRLIASASEPDKKRYERTITTETRVANRLPELVTPPAVLKGQGIIYREPMPVVIEVCAGSCKDSKPEILATLLSHAPQFGRYALIPLINKPFQKNNLSLTFAANGRLDSLTYGTESSFEKLANTMSESVSSIETYLAKKRSVSDAAAEAAAGSELKNIKLETELLNAKADKIEAAARLTGLAGSP